MTGWRSQSGIWEWYGGNTGVGVLAGLNVICDNYKVSISQPESEKMALNHQRMNTVTGSSVLVNRGQAVPVQEFPSRA